MQPQNTEKTEALRAFAHRLAVLAGRKRLRQVQISRALCVSPQRVGSWFQGRNFPGGDVELALAAMLGTSRDWLVDGKETPETKVEEPPAGYGMYAEDYDVEMTPSRQVELRKARIRQLCEEIIAAADADRDRLGWILTQMREHLRTPAHWHVPGQEASGGESAAVREAKRIGEEAAFRDAGEILAREKTARGNPPTAKSG